MAHSFNNNFNSTNSANNAFGVFLESQDAGDYILNKKAKTTFCIPNACVPRVSNGGTQSDYLMFNTSNRLQIYPCQNIINKSNLNINLITKLDLDGVEVIQDFSNNSPCPVNSQVKGRTFYFNQYNIDPSGNLFGNTPCGLNGYEYYLQYNPPPKNYIRK